MVFEVSRYVASVSRWDYFHLFYHLLGENCKSDLLEKRAYKKLHDFWCHSGLEHKWSWVCYMLKFNNALITR